MTTLPDGPVRDTPNGEVWLPNSVIQDSSLSYGARGLYVYLATFDSLPSLTRIIADHHREDRYVITRALDELVSAGLVEPRTVEVRN